jgi:general secretion pathway protein B
MSYILEALRKADAERDRGAVPDLHAQPQAGAPVLDEAEPQRGARWLGPVLGAGLVLVGALAWHFIRSDVPAAVAVAPAPRVAMDTGAKANAPAAPAAMQAPQATAAQPTPGPAASTVATVPPPAAMPTPASAAPPPPVPSAPPAPRSTPPVQAKAAARGALGSARSERAAPVQAPANPTNSPLRTDDRKVASKAEAPAPAARLPALNALPEELRRLVPPLAVGGSMYSTQPERRMVIFNGQVFQEGATLAPELLLEQIRPKSAVLSVRGQRFELPLQ